MQGEAAAAAAVVAGIGDQTKATAAMGELDTFSQKIGEARSAFGANINRLEHTVNNLSNMKENTDMANGRIMDADFAKETANMTRAQILQQAGTAMVSQANSMPNNVLSLLQ